MPQIDLIGWIVVGLIAGLLSGIVFGHRTARGCLPNLLIGVLGGDVGDAMRPSCLPSAAPDRPPRAGAQVGHARHVVVRAGHSVATSQRMLPCASVCVTRIVTGSPSAVVSVHCKVAPVWIGWSSGQSTVCVGSTAALRA